MAKPTHRTMWTGFCLLSLFLVLATSPSIAQGIDIGRMEYQNQCGVCHGSKGKGDGPLSSTLNQKVFDLTIIKKNNDGKLPSKMLIEIIDGRKILKGHGSREMPIWGKRLTDQARDFLGPSAKPEEIKKFVETKIQALITYIDKLQKE